MYDANIARSDDFPSVVDNDDADDDDVIFPDDEDFELETDEKRVL
jgi:hypothetical protein